MEENKSWRDFTPMADPEPSLEEQLKTKSREELVEMLAAQDAEIARLNASEGQHLPTDNSASIAAQLDEARDKIQAALDKLPQ